MTRHSDLFFALAGHQARPRGASSPTGLIIVGTRYPAGTATPEPSLSGLRACHDRRLAKSMAHKGVAQCARADLARIDVQDSG